MRDLSLVDTDTLVDELKGRFDSVIFVGEQRRGEQVARFFQWDGSHATCIGFCELLKGRLLQADAETPDEEEAEF
jgi:hypothetical protein